MQLILNELAKANAKIAAVPVVLPVDLDGLEHGWQACRGEQHVGGELAVAEHPSSAGAHVCRRDEQLDRASRQPPEIDGLRAQPRSWPRQTRRRCRRFSASFPPIDGRVGCRQRANRAANSPLPLGTGKDL
jgi:hypothetical protein